MYRMQLTFAPAYRQITQAERAYVDEFVSAIERASDRTGQPMSDILSAYVPSTERDQRALSAALVRTAISDRIAELVEAQNVSPRRILKEISAIAFGRIDDHRVPGTWEFTLDLDQSTPEQRAAIESVEIIESVRTGQVVKKLKLHPKLPALIALGKIQGLFTGDGEPANPELWAAGSGVPVEETDQATADRYARLINGAG